MTAFACYTSATNYIMTSHDLNESYLLLLLESLAPLKFYMSCRVCSNILVNPMSPDHTACQHTVCQKCIGGKMKLKPVCGWCQSYENFIPNKSLSTLIQCYSKLCQYTLSSVDYLRQVDYAKERITPELQTCMDKVSTLLKEGSDINYSPSTSISTPILTPAVQKSSKAASSPRKVQTFKLIIPGSINSHQPKHFPLIKGKRGRATLLLAKRRKPITSSHPVSYSVGTNKMGAAISQTPGESSTNTEGVENHSDSSKRIRKSEKLKKGCGCGNNVVFTPGKLTCYGQRCPCYSSHSPCLECRCKGCRNPNKVVKIVQASEDTDGDEINVE